jgi:L-fucose isomerase
VEDGEIAGADEALRETYGRINVPPAIMAKSLRLRAALRRLVSERRFDFVALKCLEEVINIYTSCCLPVSLLNDEGCVTACQSDINAAIAMQILRLLTDSAPMFADVNTVDKRTGLVRLVNCGSLPTTLAARKKDVEWNCQYEYMGSARGACPTFCCRAGHVTFAALSRIKGEYVMQIACGEAVQQPRAALAEVREIWPQAFVALHGDPMDFYRNLRSNHIVAAYGNVTRELLDLCELLGIRPIVTAALH